MAAQMTKAPLIEKIAAENEMGKKDVKGVLETLATIGLKNSRKNSALAKLADRDARPGQCKPPFGGKPNARTKLPTFAIQRPLQPVHVLARGADKLEPSDLQRRQLECKKIGVPGTEVSEIHQRQVGPELLIARDAFVVVQEITAAIEDEPVLVHLDGFGMMRRMAMNDGSVRPVDQLVCEPPLLFWDVVAPVRPPMEGDHDDIIRSSDASHLIRDRRDGCPR